MNVATAPHAQTVTFRETGNPWDAPLVVARYPDGSCFLSRCDEPPKGYSEVWRGKHAVVFVDGVLSAFDAARQPESESP